MYILSSSIKNIIPDIGDLYKKPVGCYIRKFRKRKDVFRISLEFRSEAITDWLVFLYNIKYFYIYDENIRDGNI